MKTPELNGILRDNLERVFPQSVTIEGARKNPDCTIFDVTFSQAERLAPNVIWRTLKQSIRQAGKVAVNCEFCSEPSEVGNIDIIVRVGNDSEHCRMCIRSVLEATPQTMRISTIEAPSRH